MEAPGILAESQVQHPRVEDDVHLCVSEAEFWHASGMREAASDGLKDLLLALLEDVNRDDILAEEHGRALCQRAHH